MEEHFRTSTESISLVDVSISFVQLSTCPKEFHELYNYSIEMKHLKPSPISEFVGKVYCINLVNRNDRLEKFMKMANKYGIDCTIMRMAPLVNCKRLMDIFKTLRKPGPRDYDSYCVPGEFGCTLSHLFCMTDGFYGGYDRIIILEDDVIPIKDVNNEFQTVRDIVSKYPYVYLGASQHTWFREIRIQKSFYNSFHTMGGFAVCIHRTILLQLMQECKKLTRKLDHIPWLFYENKKSRFYKSSIVLYPNIFIADVGNSDIRNSRDMKIHSTKLRWDLSKYDYGLL
jgi:GR25 family glycosyltransferase involved in LPS biosynthesis